MHIGRNQRCPCGSGQKYKRCCGRLDGKPLPTDVRILMERHEAREHIRQTQQGLGRPIIALKTNGYQLVGVGSTLHWSKNWKTFPDFLSDYLKRKFGAAWGNAEIAKPLPERHPLLQWYDAYCRLQQKAAGKPGEIFEHDITGTVACYLGVAYGLYLLDHNAELQDRLIKRLKDRGNFQGAYYELWVASVLIRAGFTLTLEDETDVSRRHCEFAAVSKATGKRYWVEAKMRSVAGLLGRTAADGGPDRKPLSRLVPHLNAALKKPAADKRLIFIDLNAPHRADADGKPEWIEPAMDRLERFEKDEWVGSEAAYVFVTNLAFHRHLDSLPTFAAAPFGLGMPDFARPGFKRVSEAYLAKRKHIDAFHIGDSINDILHFPTTFDGKLPSESFGRPTSRVIIGETYLFEAAGRNGEDVMGRVQDAIMMESEKKAYLVITDVERGGTFVSFYHVSDADLAEYRKVGESYFGKRIEKHEIKDNFELFEQFMKVYSKTPRSKLTEWLGQTHSLDYLATLSDEDLSMLYCEMVVACIERDRRAREKTKAAAAGQ